MGRMNHNKHITRRMSRDLLDHLISQSEPTRHPTRPLPREEILRMVNNSETDRLFEEE